MATSKDVLAQRFMNYQQLINKLSPEILSRIFATAVTHEPVNGVESGYRDVFAFVSWLVEEWHMTHRVGQRVCSFWRDVAINNPSFWTRIHIASFSHQQLAPLYLNRSGSRLIDVKLDLGKKYWDSVPIDARDHESQASHIQRMIDDLIGQHLQRCQSLRIYLACYETLPPFISMINDNAALALRFLLLEQEVLESERMLVEPFPGGTNQPRPLSGLSLPRLEELYFSKIPGEYLLGSSATTFSSLSSLTLITRRGEKSKLTDLRPTDGQLGLPSLGTGATPVAPGVLSITSYKLLNLPSLHTLTLRSNGRVAWLSYAMQAINAPRLHCLGIRSPHGPDGGRLALEIIKRVELTLNPDLASPGGLFPSLRELDISNYSCQLSLTKLMLRALSQITHICISGQHGHLFDYTGLLPRLVCIKFSPLDSSSSCSQLEHIVRSRTEAGHPIQTFQVPKSLKSQVEKIFPDTIEIQVWDDFSL